ncbi:Uncharacterised protein [Mycobacterium tuberculosis]|nr:Uncharacterised protein [Mycobacterium tuberculosis]
MRNVHTAGLVILCTMPGPGPVRARRPPGVCTVPKESAGFPALGPYRR